MLKSLQKPEESVRRPHILDDAVLLGASDNALRREIAEVTPTTIVGTLNAIVSQLRQIMYGSSPMAHWTDAPPANLQDIEAVQDVTGTSIWTSGTDLESNLAVFATDSARTVDLADISLEQNTSVVGFTTTSAAQGAPVKVGHSGFTLGGFAGLESGRSYYLSTNGSISKDPPTGSRQLIIKVGVAKSPTELLIGIGETRVRF